MQFLTSKTGILTTLLIALFAFLYFFTGVFGDTRIGITLRTNPDLENGLVAHYTFDSTDVSGFTVSDNSGNGNDGSIVATSTAASAVSVDTVNVNGGTVNLAGDHRIVWVDDQEGYIFYVRQSGSEPLVASTTDGGVTWGNNFDIDGDFDDSTYDISVWYDRWTPGDATGNKIHIAVLYTSQDSSYIEYDTAANTFSEPVQTTSQGISVSTQNGSAITKAQNGDLYITANDGSDRFTAVCSSGCTATSSWSEIAQGYPGFNQHGMGRLYPIKGTDNIMLIFMNSGAMLSSRIYSATSSSWWSIQEIDNKDQNTSYYANTMSVASDKNTGDIYTTYIEDANDYITEDHDLVFGRYSIDTYDWSTTTIASDVSGGLTNVAITINQNREGNIYIAYARRTTIGTSNTSRVYYRQSLDNGVTWSGELGPIDGGAESYAGLSMAPNSTERVNVMWRASDLDDIYYKNIKNIDDYADYKQTVGKIGQGMEFDGVDDYLIVENPGLDNINTFTYSFWIYPKSYGEGEEGDILNKWCCKEVRLLNGSGEQSIRIWLASGYANAVDGSIDLNEWQHISITYTDGIGNIPNIYKNGKLLALNSSSPAAGGLVDDSADNFHIGASPPGQTPPRAFDGKIDDVRIYNRVLSTSSIERLYQLGATTKINKTITTNPDLEDGLVLHTSFDGPSVDTSSTTGEITDLTGNNNNGNWSYNTNGLRGDVTAGKIGQGINLTGSAALNVGVTFDDSALFSGLSAVTVSAWAYVDEWLTGGSGCGMSSCTQILVGKTNLSDNREWRIRFEGGDDSIHWQLSNDGTGSGANYSDISVSVNELPVGEWINYVGWWDGSNSKLWINGELKASATFSKTNLFDGTAPLSIGDSGNSSLSLLDNWLGSIDDVRVYDRALSTSTIKRLYQLGATTKINKTLTTNPDLENGLVGHWTFDGPDTDWASTTAEILDRSGNGNNGDATNLTVGDSKIGKIGQAISFESGDAIQVNHNGVVDDLNNITIVAWIKPNSTGGAGSGRIVDKSPVNNDFLLMMGGIDTISFSARRWNTTEGSWRSSSGVPFGEWSQVVVTYNYDSTSVDPVFYINGQLVSTVQIEGPVGTAQSAVGEFFIGNSDGNSRAFDGEIDDVRIYNRELSASEILRLYQLGGGN